VTLRDIDRLFGAVAVVAAITVRVGPARADGKPETAIGVGFEGAFVDVSAFSKQVGNAVLGELGARTFDFRTVRRGEWMLQWDAFLAGEGGFLKNAGPLTVLLGGRGRADGEVGYRFAPSAAWSPYVGARGRFDARWLRHPWLSRSNANDMDGVSGLNVIGAMRLGLGASCLDGPHSLLVVAFVQEALRPTSTRSDVAFVEAGVEVRYDWSRALTAAVEASWGRADATRNRALDFTDQTTHKEVSAAVKAGVYRGVWIGAGASAARDTDRVAYSGGGRVYDTADAPSLTVGISFGVPLGGPP
jgi:hypothetical protein